MLTDGKSRSVYHYQHCQVDSLWDWDWSDRPFNFARGMDPGYSADIFDRLLIDLGKVQRQIYGGPRSSWQESDLIRKRAIILKVLLPLTLRQCN